MGRVNGRIDDRQMARLQRLRQRTGASLTDILKAALDAYLDKAERATQSPAEILNAAGFVGCADGDAQLSTTYKQHLVDGLSDKHGHR